ncbi:hypothetical protein FQN54_007596 [Arachnomyces sp. PD_36]|nr:hypothetical protein FQN54_007596 [Arachnomyces sp. PD_36]
MATAIHSPRILWLLTCFQFVVFATQKVLAFAAQDTCQHPAGLPSENSTHSYWHTEPSKILLGHRSTEDLPETADVVVIGSGIAGSFAARELVDGGKDVLMLEAREACWGATGRNGGHCKPSIYSAQAQVARFELDTYNFLKDLVTENNISCDWRSTGSVTSFYTEEQVEEAAKSLEELRKNDSSIADKVTLHTKPEDLAALRLLNSPGAVSQDEGAKLWPYKLISWVLEELLGHGSEKFNLQTNTPVMGLERVGESWLLHTTRGDVVAKDVLLTTNAYTSHLLPRMKNLVYPVRAQVSALEVTEDSIPLPHTHVWYVNEAETDVYLIQRDVSETLILGGLRSTVPGAEECISDDDSVHPDISDSLHRACASALKLRPQGVPEEDELPSSMDWTGIMGFSADGYPWVGPVPEALGGGEGLWVAAGYTGHGMPVAARAAMAAAQQILDKKGGIELPLEFVLSEERAKNLM